MSERGQGSRRKDVPATGVAMSASGPKAAATALREEETASQAVRTCQNANLLMFLEGTGTDAVSYALDVSTLLPLLFSNN